MSKKWTWEEDGYTVIRGNARTGPGCHINCGILMYVKDGKLIKVEGDPDNPFNHGRLCTRCLAVKDVVYHEDRLTYPMKRIGKRGENKWERISWDDAYDMIEKKFKELSAQYGPESILVGQGTGRDIYHMTRMAYAMGTPNWGCPYFAGTPCYLPRVASLGAIAGDVMVADCAQFFADRYDHADYTIPEIMVIWGNNPIFANSDGFYGHWVVDLMKRGTKLIVVDPQLTWLAGRAEIWLRVKPGTDGALALGMINIILEEGLHDKEFCEKWIHGLDDLRKRAAKYPVARVAEITSIPAEKILLASRRYAKAKPASIQWGLAIDQTIGGMEAAHALTLLWAITGNIDVPGGNAVARPPWGISEPTWTGGWGVEELLTEEQRAKRLGLKEYPILNFGFQVLSPDAAMKAIETDQHYPVKAIWIQSANPLSTMGAEPKKIYQIFSKLDFVVVADLFMTPTAMALADVVLPVATFAERIGMSQVYYYTGAITKAIEPVGEAKSDHLINMEMGKRFNPEAYPWDTMEEVYDAILEPANASYADLRDNGWLYPDFQYYKYEKGLLREDGQPGFNTQTGKIEAYSTVFEMLGYDPLPQYIEPLMTPTKEYPYVLTTGARIQNFFHSEHRQVERLRKDHPNPLVSLHPATAAKHGISEGDWVVMENTLGSCKMKAKFNISLDPQVIAAEHGWWFPEHKEADDSHFGTYECNSNMLIANVCGEKGFGGNQKSSICKIYKAE